MTEKFTPVKESIDVAATATPLSSTVFEPVGQTPANRALITVEDNNIRFWTSGDKPTTSEGHLVNAGGQIDLVSYREIQNFLAISVSGTAKLKASYWWVTPNKDEEQ
jgi:hypothetical protein